jgi:dihydrofolate synthase/folylpolyglutamate synthase
VLYPHWPKPLGFLKKVDNNQLVRDALNYIGNPQKKLKNIIHIAGTNGKGSTLAFIKQILLTNNYTVNCFTSPHLIHFNEQYFVQNQIISNENLTRYLEEVRLKIEEKFNLSYFQATTISAFYIFNKFNSDFNLIETGLGGRIDPTNVFTNKLAAILSPISYDHMEFLGNNLLQITCEKADILNNAENVIIAKQKPIVNACLKIILKDKNFNSAKYFKKAYDFDFDDKNFYYIDIENERIEQYNKPSLLGCHQFINLATALTTINTLTKHFTFDREKINNSIQKTQWIGRLEQIKISKSHLNNQQSVIYFDGAHNDNGARYLASWIKKTPFNGETILIYGRSSGKNHNSFLKKFKNIISKIYIVEVQNEAKPASIDEIKKNLTLNNFNIKYCNDLFEAIICNKEKKQPIRVVICGSLFLYRDIKNFF